MLVVLVFEEFLYDRVFLFVESGLEVVSNFARMLPLVFLNLFHYRFVPLPKTRRTGVVDWAIHPFVVIAERMDLYLVRLANPTMANPWTLVQLVVACATKRMHFASHRICLTLKVEVSRLATVFADFTFCDSVNTSR
jgi:hypothetical protein